MKKQRIYLDTSDFSGFFNDEFQEFTEPLFIEKAHIQIRCFFLFRGLRQSYRNAHFFKIHDRGMDSLERQ